MNNTVLTILSLSVSGSVLTLVLLALRPLLKNRVTKTFQYYIWLLVLVRLALPVSFDGSIMNRIISQTAAAQAPVVAAPADDGEGMPIPGGTIPQGNRQNAAQEIPSSDTTQAGAGTSDPGPAPVSEPASFTLLIVEHQTAIWLLGAFVYLGWFIIAYLRFIRKIRRTSVRPHRDNMEVFTRLRGHLHVQLACNPYIDTPMLIGLLSPCIVIPNRAFVANGKKAELAHILRHELIHYRRHDLLYKWFAVFISSLHWFNPLMILIRREIGRTCELSCDEAVIRSFDAAGRQDYGETLLSIASNKRLPTGVVTTTMCEEKRELKERLVSIMTFKPKNVFMVALSLILALSLAACSLALGPAKDNNQQPDDEVSPSSTVTVTPGVSPSPSPTSADGDSENTDTEVPSTNDSLVLASYQAVLQNEAEFFSTDNNQSVYLNDFLTDSEPTFNVTRFTVLDMNGDNMPEVVLELAVGDNPYFFEVLHTADGVISGYMLPYRGLEELKADGTFRFSSGAADNGWGILQFETDGYATNVLGYSESSQDDTGTTVSYFINNEPVTKESFDSFSDEQFSKDNAVWHEFSQEDIAAELTE